MRVGGSALLQVFPSGVPLKSEDEETVCGLLIGGRFPGRCRVAVADISSSSSAYYFHHCFLWLPLRIQPAKARPFQNGRHSHFSHRCSCTAIASFFSPLKRNLHWHSHRPTNFHSSTFRMHTTITTFSKISLTEYIPLRPSVRFQCNSGEEKKC